jgi:methanogenic corrinoid protein MtbC1
MELLTPRQAARAVGASESSLKRWCDQGLIEVQRTPGGHRRIPLPSLTAFARERGRAVSPGFAAGGIHAGGRLAGPEVARERILDALLCADLAALRRIVRDAFEGGTRLVEICDDWLTPALHRVGQLWANGELEIYHEHGATQVVQACVATMEGMLPPPGPTAPLAICAAPANDPYSTATGMLSLSLREAGWRTITLGADMPVGSLCRAITDLKPLLLLLSVGSVSDEEAFIDDYETLRAAAVSNGTALAVGGRALTPLLRRSLRYDFFGETLDHVVCFADGLRRRSRRQP